MANLSNGARKSFLSQMRIPLIGHSCALSGLGHVNSLKLLWVTCLTSR